MDFHDLAVRVTAVEMCIEGEKRVWAGRRHCGGDRCRKVCGGDVVLLLEALDSVHSGWGGTRL
jgi:hypothetical protein